MLHYQEDEVSELLLRGEVGLEKESLRVTEDGHMAQSADPFYGSGTIVKDFCENQVEVNTRPYPAIRTTMKELSDDTDYVRRKLAQADPAEYLWPFSNPPYLTNPEEVPIAQYFGEVQGKTEYREYLANKYGTYLMTFSGIHLNFSFAEDLLRADFKYAKADEGGKEENYRHYKDHVYLNLAEQLLRYGWILNILTAASPILDGSYFDRKDLGKDVITKYASVRCSEKGYWNPFVPVMDYSSTDAYVDSIGDYVDEGLLKAPSELYFPIRLKAGTSYTLDHLRTGWTHIELRSIDLNPFITEGLDVRDVQFAKLLMIWIACRKEKPLTNKEKLLGVDYFKRAALLRPDHENIILHGSEMTMIDAAGRIVENMQQFYRDLNKPVEEILAFEDEKLKHPDKRYAYRVLERFSGGFVEKGLAYAKSVR